MTNDLSEALHAALDERGAPAREQQPQPVERLEDPQATGDESQRLESAVPEPTEEPDESLTGEDGQAITTTAEEKPDGSADEGPRRYKPTELAEAIGWTPEELFSDLVIPLGETGESVSLGEMKDRFAKLGESESQVTAARAALQAQYEAVMRHQQQADQGAMQVSQEVAAAYDKLKGIEGQYSSQPWEKLDAENPGQAANMRQKFSTAYGAAEAELAQARQVQAQAQEQGHRQMVAAENQRLLAMVPEWQDQAKFNEEEPQISAYLISQGFTREQLGGITAAAPRAVARDAWLWRRHLAQVGKATKAVKAAPKRVIRPGGPARQTISERQSRQLDARAIQTGRQQDKMAAGRAILGSLLKK